MGTPVGVPCGRYPRPCLDRSTTDRGTFIIMRGTTANPTDMMAPTKTKKKKVI